jgi:hypothetical protein
MDYRDVWFEAEGRGDMERKGTKSNVVRPDTAPDFVNDPPHYSRLSPQPIDVIDMWGLGFYPAQVLKYIARAGFKGADSLLQDLEKAAFYLNRWIARVKNGRE